MKYFGIFYVMLSVLCFACNGENWSKTEQDAFLSTCFDEGGSKNYCSCFLDKMMEYSPIAEEVEQIDFEQKVELAKDCE
jgi:hypothetical protein